MTTVTVNKLDTQANDASEFEIETLDDIQTGGADSTKLSVPLNNNSLKANSLEKADSTNQTIDTNLSVKRDNANLIPVSEKESDKPQSSNAEALPEESEFPAETDMPTDNMVVNESTKMNESVKLENETEPEPEQTKPEQTKPEQTKEESVNKVVNTPVQKTKKKGKKHQGKVVGATKKKIVAPHAIVNDVQPHVEFGNERGTMTIKYASAKTVVPLYSTAKSAHLNLADIKAEFTKEYDNVKAMKPEQLTELRHEMQNTEFSDIGADALIHGLLSLIDDHDTKKLTLKMMLARGLLKITA